MSQLITYTLIREPNGKWSATTFEPVLKMRYRAPDLDALLGKIGNYLVETGASDPQFSFQLAIYPWDPAGGQIRVIFQISKTGKTYSAKDIQGTELQVAGDTLEALIEDAQAKLADSSTAMFKWDFSGAELSQALPVSLAATTSVPQPSGPQPVHARAYIPCIIAYFFYLPIYLALTISFAFFTLGAIAVLSPMILIVGGLLALFVFGLKTIFLLPFSIRLEGAILTTKGLSGAHSLDLTSLQKIQAAYIMPASMSRSPGGLALRLIGPNSRVYVQPSAIPKNERAALLLHLKPYITNPNVEWSRSAQSVYTSLRIF